MHITRSAYYRWRIHPKSSRELENERIAEEVKNIHNAHPDMGYRRIRDELDRRHDIHVSDKRILRISRAIHIQSTIKYGPHGCTKSTASPECTAENHLNRQFRADAPNQKWATDVTEFKYYIGLEGYKVYLSGILDLFGLCLVADAIGDHNDNQLVFDTFDAAVAANDEAHPMFHSDRGFQYTSRVFQQKLQAAGMKQSMSRVAHCLDNGPMEGFWGIMKREMYYGRRYTSREELVQAIRDYIHYYNYERLQRRLSIMTPMEFREHYALAV